MKKEEKERKLFFHPSANPPPPFSLFSLLDVWITIKSSFLHG